MTLIDPDLLASLETGARANKGAMAATLTALDDAILALQEAIADLIAAPPPVAETEFGLSVTDETANFSLTSANASILIAGQAFTFDKLFRVNASGGAVNITLDGSCPEGGVWAFLVTDATNAVTLKRGTWTFARTGDFEAASADITNVPSITNIAAGYGLSGAAIGGGVTVSGSPSGSTVTMSEVATQTLPAEAFTVDAGIQGAINGRAADLRCLPGLVIVRCFRASFGVEVIVTGSTDEAKDVHGGFVPIATSQGTTDEMLGRTVLASHADTEIVLAVEDDATMLANSMRASSMENQFIAVERTGAAAVKIDDSETETNVTILLPDNSTLSTAWAIPNVGQVVVLQWRSANTWKIIA